MQTKKSVSTEAAKDIQAQTGLSSDELDLVLKGDLEDLEMYTPIDRVS